MSLAALTPQGLLLKALPYLLAAAGAGLALWWAYDWAYDRGVAAERTRWEAAVAEAGTRFSEALAAQQQTITQLERDLTAARRKANTAREDLADAITQDPDSDRWSRTAIPDRVRAALGDRGAVPPDP